MKTQIESQLHDKDMRKYLIEREVWTDNKFDETTGRAMRRPSNEWGDQDKQP
jgi:fructosamine-3-kinase